jgi:hypothetical protein
MALAVAVLLPGAAFSSGTPVLHDTGQGWVAVTGLPPEAAPPADDWGFADGIWTGRVAEDQQLLEWPGFTLPLAEAEPLPLAPVLLWQFRNPFGPCVVKSLSVRFDSQIRDRRWSLVFAKEGEPPAFEPLDLPGKVQVPLALELEDAVSGRRWTLTPSRQGREGSMFSRQRGDARFYSGVLEEEGLEWTLLVAGPPGSRPILQGRILSLRDPLRLLRWRLTAGQGAPGIPLLQEESPPAVLTVADGTAVALFPDLGEPRRFRAAAGPAGGAGIEFDLAVTRTTGNFPRSATISLELDAWPAVEAEAAAAEAVRRLARGGKDVPLPAELLQAGPGGAAVIELSRTRLVHPGGFRDFTDILSYLSLRMSGLFADAAWTASAFLCAAQDGQGQPMIRMDGDAAVVTVNADPDLETVRDLGQNRGLMVLDRVRRSLAPAIWLKTLEHPPGLDHHMRALHMCDYPAVWEEGVGAPGVDLRHAEAELIAALACVLKDSGTCLLVEDAGPLAPFTTFHADALVCASADPAEMRRQRALAGPRPVLWTAREPGAAARELAVELGFVTPAQINED